VIALKFSTGLRSGDKMALDLDYIPMPDNVVGWSSGMEKIRTQSASRFTEHSQFL